MTILTADRDLADIREAGDIIKNIFDLSKKMIRQGVTTAELDREIEELISSKGAVPAFKGYKGYPAAICASVNDVVVHGIPSNDIVLEEGDIVGIDVGVKMNGFYADAARTYTVGHVSDEALHLIEVTRESMLAGIEQAIEGNRVSDISNAIQNVASKYGYQEVRTFVGHGIGRDLHEPPEVPNWGEGGRGIVLEKGLCLAIEPMINQGSRKVDVLKDGWTAVTHDGKLSAHFENTVIVGEKKAEIIT